ncbi:MAG: response regulator [Anaerolineaceae bacterium]|nr:MAG: response regulator [Anaerolineaceae bacterium]
MAEKTALIVDGDGASRNFLARLLEQKDCRVLETSLGREGLIFAWRDHPDLILVDPKLSDLPGEELIHKLRADARSASIPAIALSSDPNPAREAACREAGFNEYFYKSANDIPALMDAIELWLASRPDETPSTLEQTAPLTAKQKGGLLIIFISAKGGTGASSLCANLAMNIFLHQPRARVVVLDSVLPIGSIASIVGYDGGMNLVTLAAMPPAKTDEAFFRENLPKLPAWKFHLVAGSPDPESAASLRADRIGQIVQSLQAAFDFVFIDVGRALSQIILPIIQQADLIAMPVSPDMGTVRLSRVVWQYLQSKGLSKDHIFTILNRAVGFESISKAEVEGTLGLTVQSALPHLVGNLLMANSQNVPFASKFPNDTASMILKEVALQMITHAGRVRAESQQGGSYEF